MQSRGYVFIVVLLYRGPQSFENPNLVPYGLLRHGSLPQERALYSRGNGFIFLIEICMVDGLAAVITDPQLILLRILAQLIFALHPWENWLNNVVSLGQDIGLA